MWVSFIKKKKKLNKKLKKKTMNWIQNDNQNVEGVNTPKLDSHYYLFIGDILFHNVTQFWCCFMSDDGVRWDVEACSFGFFAEILYPRCV